MMAHSSLYNQMADPFASGSGEAGQTPNFQQITPFSEWCPPVRATDPPALAPSQLPPSRNSWLFKHCPEACVGDDEVKAILADELGVKGSARLAPPAESSACLMAVGEISDTRHSGKATGHAALAFASGESGNVLCLLGMSHEDRSWAEEHVTVHLNTPDTRLDGEWCQDSAPISLVKFASDPDAKTPIRWLLVQKAASTTICAPELRELPSRHGEPAGKAAGGAGLAQIFVNPLATIRCEQTGGFSHSDLAFSPSFGEDAPQLAIIDTAGCWSVWDITSHRSAGRLKSLNPVVRMCGSISLGSIPDFPAITESTSDRDPHRIAWLLLDAHERRSKSRSRSRKESRARSRKDSYSRSRRGSSSKQPSGSVEITSPPSPSRLLLMSTTNALSLFDVDTGRFRSVSRKVLSENQQILDVAPSLLDRSQAFILTESSVVWVATREHSSGKLTLDVLASCPHEKDNTDPELKLNVSPGAYVNGREACFVCVRSTRDSRMAVIWCIPPEPGAAAQCHRELVSLNVSFNFVGMDMLLVSRRTGAGKTEAPRRNALTEAKPRFFQILTMGPDLAVHSSLCAWLDGPDLRLEPPDTLVDRTEAEGERVKPPKRPGDAFAVPDGFDDGVSPQPAGEEPAQDDSGETATLELWPLPAYRADRGRSRPKLGALGDAIDDAVERERRDGYMPRRSLLDLVGRGRTVEELAQLSTDWTTHQRSLIQDAAGWLEVPAAAARSPGPNLDAVYKDLKNMFHPLQRTSKLGKAAERQRAALERMTAELFLAKIGIATPPHQAKSTDRHSSQIPASSPPLPFRSSPPLPLPQSSPPTALDDGDDVDDEVVLRLRKYATVGPSVITSDFRDNPVLAHWRVGEASGDETSHWISGENEEELEQAAKQRRKMDTRRRRAEKHAAKAAAYGTTGLDYRPVMSMPTAIMSSQPRRVSAAGFSQIRSSQVVRSQVVPGAFGGRTLLQARKPKVKEGFR
ncbi:RNA polymerase I-specific transcription initiation factor RRN6-like protein [Lasiosphaeria miniovina]|uniref:RNA polymerase I-specific transcription initiation factor RRN6-like protein n=1 Tax=Lasiosphaeria miniovina TaxID=1954250 RepID=A0AA40A4B6_9PEZI|nr:RNA polymerase I-specific transcription initiation factor RRN6-like protein [Lasiosphaeria miniovina]KAK0709005.1 RNA polymerase I-specific transcription initiation factor RRN6-like protein [Lasiosphaeria miniovina]